MRYKQLFDKNTRTALICADSREQALSLAEGVKDAHCVLLFPSLKGEIGVLCRSALWGNALTVEALRAVAFYFGRVAGWPMREITAELEDGSLLSLPLARSETEEIPIKIKFCKQKYENITVFTHSVSHIACLFPSPYSFVLVESKESSAVNFSALKSLRSQYELRGLPICLAFLSGEKLALRVMDGRGAQARADDRICLSALSYFIETGRAAYGKEYRICAGKYRIESGGIAEAVRALSLI